MHRINSDLADWILLVTEQVCSICTPDFMTFAEDMSYNNGSMLSKRFLMSSCALTTTESSLP